MAGGLGFIGSHLVHRLAAAGARVRVLDALAPGTGGDPARIASFPPGVATEVADVADAPTLDALLDGCDAVFDLVGRRDHAASMDSPLDDLAANCAAQLALLEGCRRARRRPRVVFASSRQVYGPMRAAPVGEDHPLRPVDVNGVHKRTAEEYHRLYREAHGVLTACLRLPNVYGPGMDLRPGSGGFLGAWLGRLEAGDALPVWGDGAERRDLLDVDDACDALLLAASLPSAVGAVLNAAGVRPYSFLEIAAAMVAVAGRGSWRYAPAPEAERRIALGDFVLDGTRAATVLGWRARTDLPEGLRRVWHWMESRPAAARTA